MMGRITFAFFLLISGITYAQTDSIYVTVQGDTATIWHTQTYRNCAFMCTMDVQLTDYQITVMEVELTGPWANCNCYFDLSVTIGTLEAGYYTVDIFSSYSGDTLYWGSTSFTINGISYRDSLFVISQYQSDCYELNINDFDNLKPIKYFLSQNYPNPFNPLTIIHYQIPKEGKVVLMIYNLLGKPIRTLVDTEQEAGDYLIDWDGKDGAGSRVGSGIYFYRLKIGHFVQVKKMVLLD